jgi:hypothetical protein
MSDTHWDRCVAHVEYQTDILIDAMTRKRRPISFSEAWRFMHGYLDAPAFDRTWRDDLHKLSMERISNATGKPVP